ncbi:hypothetical protein HMPREF9065_00432 [Aggregatibacter sp. oral taxon 458 str. W10330]|nr:hypothetical protein HMPREF9065_00432 [Aggregatibacter sp. oral taxon 458 str. W10330]
MYGDIFIILKTAVNFNRTFNKRLKKRKANYRCLSLFLLIESAACPPFSFDCADRFVPKGWFFNLTEH